MKSLVGRYCGSALLPAVAMLTLLSVQGRGQTAAAPKDALDTFWTVPEVGALPDDAYGRLVRRGRATCRKARTI